MFDYDVEMEFAPTSLDKEEYLALQNEMREARRGLTRLEYACGVGALLAFSFVLLTATGYVGYQGLLWLTPIAFPAYGCVRAWALSSRIKLIGRYLARLESSDGEQGRDRWSTFSARERSVAPRVAVFLMWAVFLVGTVAGSMAGYADFRDQCPGVLRDACSPEQGSDGDAETAPTRQTTRVMHVANLSASRV